MAIYARPGVVREIGSGVGKVDREETYAAEYTTGKQNEWHPLARRFEPTE